MSRLIDADELWEKMYSYSDNEGAKMPYGDDDSFICKDSACFLIENAPTIEPERKTGKWIKAHVPTYDGDYIFEWECDQCHERQIIPQKFCGECGARMEESGQE